MLPIVLENVVKFAKYSELKNFCIQTNNTSLLKQGNMTRSPIIKELKELLHFIRHKLRETPIVLRKYASVIQLVPSRQIHIRNDVFSFTYKNRFIPTNILCVSKQFQYWKRCHGVECESNKETWNVLRDIVKSLPSRQMFCHSCAFHMPVSSMQTSDMCCNCHDSRQQEH